MAAVALPPDRRVWADPGACSVLCQLILDDRRSSSGAPGSPAGGRRRPRLPPTLYSEHVAQYLRFEAVLPDMLYAFGGRNRRSGPVADVEMLDTWHGVWVTCPPMPRRRAGSSAAALPSGRILLAGGYNEHGIVAGLLKSCDVYDPVAEAWHEDGAAPLGRARWGHGCAALSDRVYVVGGCSLQTDALPQEAFMETLRSCEVYDATADKWRPCGSLQVARSGSRVVAMGEQYLAAVGGCDDVFGRAATQASIEIYDVAAGAWSVLENHMAIPRTSAAVAAIDGWSFVVAGGAPSQASVEVCRVPLPGRGPPGAPPAEEPRDGAEEFLDRCISDMPEGRMGCQAAVVRLPCRTCADADSCGVADHRKLASIPAGVDRRCLVIVGGERCGMAGGSLALARVSQLSSVVAYDLDEWRWCDKSTVPCMSHPRTTMALCTGLGAVAPARAPLTPRPG